ncbi:MAG: ferredoxin [Spirochaetes bacterium]|nr:ferredoxin [Spirochaetota bacterium]
MLYHEEELENEGIKYALSLLAGAIKTAPKSKGINTLQTIVLTDKDKDRIADEMQKNEKTAFQRDSINLKKAQAVILIGVKTLHIGLDCGMCRHKDCNESKEKNGLCIFNLTDLGIALGSLVSSASQMKIDNRIMYTIGFTAKNMGFFEKEYDIIMGIPLSYNHKNIFFDRK